MPRGQKLSEAYVELHADDSKLRPEVKIKATKVGRQFGSQLNQTLRQLNIEGVDIKADPRQALASVESIEARLRAMSRDAATVEVKVRTERALSGLSRFRKQLGDVAQQAGPEAASGFAARFSAQIGPLLAKAPLSPPLLIAAGTAASVIAPLIGGIISSAVIGGVGIGGVVGGMTLAAKDPRVAAAGKTLGQVLTEDLETRASRAFVGPMLEAITRVTRGYSAMGGDLDKIFRNTSKLLAPLTEGVLGFVQRVTKGVADLTEAAGPVIEVLSAGIGNIGDAIGDTFSSLKDNGVDAAVALRIALQLVETTIRTIGVTVNALTESFGLLARIGAFGRDAQLEYFRLAGNAKLAKDANLDAAKSMGTVRDAGSDLAKQIGVVREATYKLLGPIGLAMQSADAHARALRGETGAMTELNNALRAEIDPAFAVINAQNKLKIAQDKAAEAIRKHGRNSKESREATRNLATAALDLQGRVGALSTGFNGRLSPAMLATFKAAKLTKGQIKDVERELRAARGAAVSYDGAYRANVTATGVPATKKQLDSLLVRQQALSKGISVSAASSAFRKQEAKAFHTGGWTGPGSKYDPAGVVHADEFVIKKESRRRIEARAPGLLEEMNATGQAPGYASGGRAWPFPATSAMTRIMSLSEALSKVAPSFGNWPSSPGAQRGDSGVWRQVLRLIKSGPKQGSFGNAYRGGDPKWHGSGRAVDWMGFNMDALASFLASKRPLELIHRTSRRDYAYTRGRNKGSFSEGLMNAHRNHIHIAMSEGGRVPTMDRGGRWPSGTVRANLSGRTEVVSTGANMDDAVTLLGQAVDLLSNLGQQIGRQAGLSMRNADALIGSQVNRYARTA